MASAISPIPAYSNSFDELAEFNEFTEHIPGEQQRNDWLEQVKESFGVKPKVQQILELDFDRGKKDPQLWLEGFEIYVKND